MNCNMALIYSYIIKCIFILLVKYHFNYIHIVFNYINTGVYKFMNK